MKINIKLEKLDYLQHQLTEASVAIERFKLAIEEINKIEIDMKTVIEEK